MFALCSFFIMCHIHLLGRASFVRSWTSGVVRGWALIWWSWLFCQKPLYIFCSDFLPSFLGHCFMLTLLPGSIFLSFSHYCLVVTSPQSQSTVTPAPPPITLHYITCHLADAFIQSDLQLIRLSRRHTPWSNVGLRALLKGPTAVQILSYLIHTGDRTTDLAGPSPLA